MKIRKMLLTGVVILSAALSGCGMPKPAEQPMDEKEAVLSVYRELLKAAPAVAGEHEELFDASMNYERNVELFGNHYDSYALQDIDKNGIPELITLSTVNFRWTPVSVFTYANGKVGLLKDPLDPAAHGTFEQNSSANGAYFIYFCEENHIHNVWRGTDPFGNPVEENQAYALEGAALTAAACSVGESGSTVYFSDIAKENTADA